MPALELLKDKPLTKQLVHATVEQHSDDNLPWGAEPIVYKDEIIGTVTSACYSFSKEKPVCLGFLESKEEPIDSSFFKEKYFHILIAGQRYPIHISNVNNDNI